MIRAFIRRFLQEKQGYTLVVIAALFAAFAVSVSAYLDRNTAGQQITYQQQTREQLARIATAINQYYYYKKHYPCPARPDLLTTDIDFGNPVANCHTGSPAGIGILSNSSDELVIGMVPVRVLAQYGIDVNDIFDVWGSRIMYVMNRNLSPSGSGVAVIRAQVKDHTILSNLQSGDYLVVSFGRDRRGAYQKNQTATGLASGPPIACTSGDLRGENCDNDREFRVGSPNVAPNVAPGNYFDDVLIVGPQLSTTTTGDDDDGGGGSYCPTGQCYSNPSACPDSDCYLNGSMFISTGANCGRYRCNNGVWQYQGVYHTCIDHYCQ